jgi:hypothetical protein
MFAAARPPRGGERAGQPPVGSPPVAGASGFFFGAGFEKAPDGVPALPPAPPPGASCALGAENST